MKRIFILSGCILSFVCLQAQQMDKNFDENARIVGEYLEAAQGITSPNELMVKAALSLLNTPYVAQTLEEIGRAHV